MQKIRNVDAHFRLIVSYVLWSIKESNVLGYEKITLDQLYSMTGHLVLHLGEEQKWPEMFHEKLYLRLFLNEVRWNAGERYNSLMYFYVSQYIHLYNFKLLYYTLVNN